MPRKVVPLVLGWQILPRSVSVLGGPEDVLVVEPVPAVLVETDGGWALLDTGLNPALVSDAPLRQRFHGGRVTAVLPEGEGDPLVKAFRSAGVAICDIALVALSHLHNDHAGGLRHFADLDVPVAVQRAELDYGLQALHPGPETNGIFRIDFDDPRINWWLLDGDTELAPGLRAISTPGHTHGHQSFLVESVACPTGRELAGLLLAFDAADLTENIEEERVPGVLVGGDEKSALASIRRLKSLARQYGASLVPGHDPDAWPALVAQLGASLPACPL